MMKILNYDEASEEEILARAPAVVGEDVTAAVAEILRDVRENGDAALLKYCERFDGAKLSSIEATSEEMERAGREIPENLKMTMLWAARNIRRFHERQLREGFILTNESGLTVGQRVIPLERVGVYVPGGRAAYPSTVLMDVLPATIAGCGEVIVVTPPRPDGTVDPAILAAASIAGADQVFKIGGAQAVTALAWGTETVPKVDKIVGPGNVYVAEAKRQVFGVVDIDMIAGPSEILIVADEASDPRWVAADLLSQAEHDPMASAVLITDSPDLARAVQAAIEHQLSRLERRDIARASIEANGKIIVTSSLEEAVYLANELAPEHLELCLDDPFAWLGRVRNAGSVFLGRYCPEALGDYLAGPNHTLPTGGTARFASPLSVDDFVKKSQFIHCSPAAMENMAGAVATFAEHEGLTAHSVSALVRLPEVSKGRTSR